MLVQVARKFGAPKYDMRLSLVNGKIYVIPFILIY